MADFGTVARPYARALFEHAKAGAALDPWSDALGVAAAVVEDAGARAMLARPDLKPREQAKLIADVCAALEGGRLLGSAQGRNLLNLLAENDRLPALPEISRQFLAHKSKAENRIKVKLVAAAAPEDGVAQKVARSLEQRLGRQVELELEIDASLMGGGVVRAEDRVIDGSVRSRLRRLADSLLD